MQEYAKLNIKFVNDDSADKLLPTVEDLLRTYPYVESDRCNWINHVKVINKRIDVDSDGMCGWMDYMDLISAITKLLAEQFPEDYFTAESEYTNISTGFNYYINVTLNGTGIETKETSIVCDYCGNPVFDRDDCYYMKNEDDEVVALCCDECRDTFLEDDDDQEWEESDLDEYEETNGF